MNPVNTKLWVHAVLISKNLRQLITPALAPRLNNFIHEKLLELGCPSRIINGMPEHIHLLFLQNPARSMAEVVKKIKSTSSFFVNESHLCPQKFYWQPGYAAFAVSESQVQKVYEYISNQEEHHLKEKFVSEYQLLLQLHGLISSDE
jgi:putative transposase